MKRIIFLTAGFLLAFFAAAMAQTVDTTGLADNPVFTNPTVETLTNAYNIVYGALVIVWGYVGKAFKLHTKVSNYVWVVLAGGVVMAGGFIAFGVGKALPLLFAFLSSIGLYDIIFKPLFGNGKAK